MSQGWNSIGEGTGIVHFADGALWGPDSISTVVAIRSMATDFTATIRTKRHTKGHATVLGIGEMELQLVGTAIGTFVTAKGRRMRRREWCWT